MANPEVTVIDSGMGNIYSVTRAFEACGATVKLTDSPEDIVSAQLLVLPGVGAFKDGMEELRLRGLTGPIGEYARTGRPLLGICLGMQMLMERSEEFGDHEGLGLIQGNVVAIPNTTEDGERHKIPHIGWNELKKTSALSWDGSILDGINEDNTAYFVHSFTCVPLDESHRLADSHYNGRRISAAIQFGNVYGCQFHPEKSAQTGLKIISNFLSLT
jgi:glutamine amidotransferase